MRVDLHSMKNFLCRLPDEGGGKFSESSYLVRFNFFQYKLASGQRRELFSAAARADKLLNIRGEFLAAVDALRDARQRFDRERRALIRRPVGHGLPAVGEIRRNKSCHEAKVQPDNLSLIIKLTGRHDY